MKVETPILRRLGPVPFWRGSVKCLEELERIYRKSAAAAADSLSRVGTPARPEANPILSCGIMGGNELRFNQNV